MSKIKSGFATVLAAGQLLGFDWIANGRRTFWDSARWQLRTLHFRAHSQIPAATLSEICRRIGPTVDGVLMPSPTVNTEGVGSPDYYFALAAITRVLNPRIAVEFGTYLGVGTLTMALNAPNAAIYTFDLPDSVTWLHSLDATDLRLVQESRNRIGEAFIGKPQASRINQVRVDSEKLHLPDLVPKADMVVIDGGHSLSVVTADTDNAFTVLGERGVIVWDDYWWLYPDVVRYLEQKARDLPLKRIEGTNLVVYFQE
jgi:hypothetical protein